jgi:hypothetical protein
MSKVIKLSRRDPAVSDEKLFSVRVYELLDIMVDHINDLNVTVTNLQTQITLLEARVEALEP